MGDDVVNSLLEPVPSTQESLWGLDWLELQAYQRDGDYASLRKGAAKLLRTKSKHLRIARWWVEANTHLEGFQGLAQGIRLLGGLWRHFTSGNDYDHELSDFIAADLRKLLLQVCLADVAFDFTFTTVINARRDPELQVEVNHLVARFHQRWAALIPQIKTVEDALLHLESAMGQWDKEAIDNCRRTLHQMRSTISDWAQSDAQAEEQSSEPAIPTTPAPEPDYQIYLWIEDVPGESQTPHHTHWIEALSYKQHLNRTIDVQDAPTLAVDKLVDRASPALYHAVHTERIFPTVNIEVCRATTAAECFLRIELSDAAISHVSQTAVSSSGKVRPAETVVFDYRRIQWTYRKLRPDDAASLGNTCSSWTRTD